MLIQLKMYQLQILRIAIFLLTPIPIVNAQSFQLKSSTLTSIGIGTVQVENYIVQQSIGQSSVVGPFKNKGIYFFQGFLNGATQIKKSSEMPLKIVAYPNSFVGEVNFRFVPGYKKQVEISIFDFIGRNVFKGVRIPIDNEIELDLEFLSVGLYVVIFNYENTFSQVRIIKS